MGTFARDLLIEGLEHTAGEGDVVVRSEHGLQAGASDARTFIRLQSPEGTALLSMPRAHLVDYLTATRQLVPTGTEHQHLSSALSDLDIELGQLTCPGFSD